MNRFQNWMRRLIDEPEDLTLEALQATQRAQRARQIERAAERFGADSPVLDTRYLVNPLAPK